MKLIKVPATEKEANSIRIIDVVNNHWATIYKVPGHGRVKFISEDNPELSVSELNELKVISDNFDLFFNNIKN